MTSIPDMTFASVDFETANWHKTSICSVGIVCIENGEEVDSFHSFVYPRPFEFNTNNVRVHGIREVDVYNAPSIEQIWPEIRNRLQGKIVAAHNAAFERGIIHALEAHTKEDCGIVDWLCTLYQSRVYLPGLQNHKLPTVYHHLFSENIKHHNALEDARASAKIAQHLAKTNQVPTFNGMVRSLPAEPREVRMSRKTPPLVSFVKEEGYEHYEYLKGRDFCFTGQMRRFRKEDAWQLVVNFGGKINDSATRSTTDLVVSYESQLANTGKMKKVQEAINNGKNINILTEDDFYRLVESLVMSSNHNPL